MMKLGETIGRLRGRGECAFMPYVCAGDPDEEACENIVGALVAAGADVIEFGLPFSDPIADGPTIQRASQRSLASGMNTEKYFRLCERVSRKHAVPLIAMTYYNLILQYGIKRFAGRCARSGVYGIITPDLPIEESDRLYRACRKNKIDLIFLVAPTTTGGRLERILGKASGFVYLVSVLGVTGARDRLSGGLPALVEKVKGKTTLPVCVGFGISKPGHARRARELGADGVIAGSAIIDVIERNLGDRKRMLAELEKYAGEMKKACVGRN